MLFTDPTKAASAIGEGSKFVAVDPDAVVNKWQMIRKRLEKSFDKADLERLNVALENEGERVALLPMPPAVPLSGAKQVEHECYVTRDMLANYLRCHKKKLERLSKEGKLCDPDIEGGGGKAHQWKYSRIRPYLETEFARQLPERWPGEAFAFSD